MSKDECSHQAWRVAVIDRHTPDNDGIRSLVLAPLADDGGGYVWLLIRFRTRTPAPSGIEGDHLFLSEDEARAEGRTVFGVRDEEWEDLPREQRSWLVEHIRR